MNVRTFLQRSQFRVGISCPVTRTSGFMALAAREFDEAVTSLTRNREALCLDFGRNTDRPVLKISFFWFSSDQLRKCRDCVSTSSYVLSSQFLTDNATDVAVQSELLLGLSKHKIHDTKFQHSVELYRSDFAFRFFAVCVQRRLIFLLSFSVKCHYMFLNAR